MGISGRDHGACGSHLPWCPMSLEAMLWALKQAPDVPAQCVGVLMGLAEGADRHGRGALPSALTLAAFARKSERQVRADLGMLTELKLIRPGNQALAAYIPAGRRPTVYDLAMEHICDLQSTAPRGKPRGSHSRRRDLQSTAPLNDEPGLQWTAPLQSTAPQDAPDLQEQPEVQSTAGPGRGAVHCRRGVQSSVGRGAVHCRQTQLRKPRVKTFFTSPRSQRGP